jgi:hypothetical protein
VEITRGADEVLVLHGSQVETGDDFFVEGAWSEPFREIEFPRSSIFMGSGGKILDGALILCSPTHTAERLHLLRQEDRLLVSNSMTFLLERAELSLDTSYIAYHSDLISIIGGLEDHVRAIPATEGRTVELFYHTNLRITSDLVCETLEKSQVAEFSDFRSYQTFLVEGLEGLRDNADADARNFKYALLTTVSSGYDSAACAALAVDAGCREAVTIRDSRHRYGSGDDSGAQIAEILGLNVVEVGRSDYLKKAGHPEAEFVACGDLGQDVVFSSFEPLLQGRLLLTGFHGGKVWDRNCKVVSQSIVRGDPSGNSLTEFRLRVGFIHVPVPFIGCQQHPSLHRIGNSAEMGDWQVGGDYDRPIPRRIVEAKGVEREMFGTKKKAVSVLLNSTLQDLRTKMKSESIASLEAKLPGWRSQRDPFEASTFRGMYATHRAWTFLGRAMRKLGMNLPASPIPARFRQHPGVPSFLIHWGISDIRRRYRIDGNLRTLEVGK